jgi:phosphoribosylformylglycinamidine synthase
VPDVSRRVTSELKQAGDELWLLRPGDKRRLGGSALAQVQSQLGDDAPDIEDAAALKAVFRAVQELVKTGAIAACHDVSDGGLIVTLLEMAFAGDKGWRVEMAGPGRGVGEGTADEAEGLYAALFAEEAGVVVEVADEVWAREILERHGVAPTRLGTVQDMNLELRFNQELVLDEPATVLHATWEETGYRLERLQIDPACADEEWLSHGAAPATKPYHLTFDPDADVAPRSGTHGTALQASAAKSSAATKSSAAAKPRVAVLREEGTNGDREMAASFIAAGFEAWDVTMTDLLSGALGLAGFQMIVFPGGFSFADVLDSGKGWASVILNNARLAEEFEEFFARSDTLSLGVCNGCQLMALLGIPGFDLADALKPRFIRNRSERFESRFSTVRIDKGPAVMLQGMEGSVLGVWVAHGEGRLHVPDPATLDWIVAEGLTPVRYVDPQGEATIVYPYNPNGSPLGIAALCSPDGRHLAIMPHPERSYQLRQWPWVPPEWTCADSPWMRMFRNARAALL